MMLQRCIALSSRLSGVYLMQNANEAMDITRCKHGKYSDECAVPVQDIAEQG
jgi:hypothetical protein